MHFCVHRHLKKTLKGAGIGITGFQSSFYNNAYLQSTIGKNLVIRTMHTHTRGNIIHVHGKINAASTHIIV